MSGRGTSGPRRYAPDHPFPPYAFLPGRDPHPTRDPRGHSHGAPEEPSRRLDASAWRSNAPYLHGVDLYNHGYLWEAHEAWEGLWHASKPDARQARFLQGLIQCAAACLKVAMEQPEGLVRLAELGTGRLESVALEAGALYMGLDVEDFVRRMRAFAASEPRSVVERPPLRLAVEGVEPPVGAPMPRPG